MEGLQSALCYLNEISAILRPSFGPNGKDVLLKSGTGVIYLTKNGSSILQQLLVKHPIATFVKNAVQTYISSAGDFSKTYLLTMQCFLDLIQNNYMNDIHQNRLERTRSVLSLLSCSLTRISSALSAEMIAAHANELGCLKTIPGDSFLNEYFDGVFAVLVSGKFSSEITRKLKDMIRSVFTIIPFTRENIVWMIEHFDTISIQVSGVPFSESRFVEGSIVQREPVPREAACGECKFILMSGSVSQSAEDNLEMCFGEDSGVLKHQTTSREFYKKVVSVLVGQGVAVVFVEHRLPFLFGSALQSAGIIYVPFVEEDDLCWLSERYNISLMSGVYDLLQVENFSLVVGRATFFKSCTLGLHVCSYLGPQPSKTAIPESKDTEATWKPNFHFIFSAIYEGLGAQYSDCVLNCLRVLSKCFDHQSSENTVRLIPSCGFFEGSLMSEVLVSVISTSTGSANKRGISKVEHGCENETSEHGCSDTVCYGKTSDIQLNCDEIEVLKLLVEALQVVWSCLRANSNAPNKKLGSHFKVKESSEISDFISEVGKRTGPRHGKGVCIDSISGSIMGAHIVRFYEPLESKVELLRSMLECCSQVLRIDTIVPVTKVIRIVEGDSDDVGDGCEVNLKTYLLLCIVSLRGGGSSWVSNCKIASNFGVKPRNCSK